MRDPKKDMARVTREQEKALRAFFEDRVVLPKSPDAERVLEAPAMTKMEALAAIDASPVRAGQRWQHWKTKDIYTIICVGIDEPTLEPVVVYATGDGVPWTRKLAVFLSNAKETGEPRFKPYEY